MWLRTSSLGGASERSPGFVTSSVHNGILRPVSLAGGGIPCVSPLTFLSHPTCLGGRVNPSASPQNSQFGLLACFCVATLCSYF